MDGFRTRWIAVSVLLVLAACATTTAALNLHLGGQVIDLGRFLKDHPLAPQQNIRVDLIGTGETSSVHVVQVRDSEAPHVHANHDLRVVVLRGRGTLVIGHRKIRAGVGSVFEIERGTRHYFVNAGPRPAAALATFTPPYDGSDMAPAPD
ncbi:MAG: hypothetical protein A3G34_16665 [Candidatus Lindowbacteria bacterium RIFCSPLOWO2_12_FULL_62_27]|nr:MAG: hypothetical protein A3G34_16665 [Candidatus Lindowbacteria bacterium RIFCSPLOWO2_12_FULL_62_27]OGH63657.1 MAG: hypothetical protein A3I06_05490 [Candidatus Lindowbacteria bacterium RIFCSPLOWO2_02_FULL_62_12]